MEALNIARYGMMAAERRFGEAAMRIVQSAGDDSIDLSREMVEALQARTQFRASAKIFQFADDMWRALMDIQKR
jgi:flagellar hook protein FlgE